MPVFATARETARRSSCTNNLKQISLALQNYIQDNDEFFPSVVVDMYDKTCLSTYWTIPKNAMDQFPLLSDVLLPYSQASSIFICPSTHAITDNDTDGKACYVTDNEIRNWRITYMQRTELSMLGINIQTVKNPSMIDVLHCHGEFHGGSNPNGRKYNVLFLDGHVKTLTRNELILVSNREL